MKIRGASCVVALAVFGAVVLDFGCSSNDSSGTTATESQAPVPQLAGYDRSCLRDSDCALVSGEGCAPCGSAALSAKAAPRYSAALVEARKTPSCQSVIERAGACPSEGPVVARCDSSLCIVASAPVSEAGADVDGSSDASSE